MITLFLPWLLLAMTFMSFELSSSSSIPVGITPGISPNADSSGCRAVDACIPCTALEKKSLPECVETGYKQKWLCSDSENALPPPAATDSSRESESDNSTTGTSNGGKPGADADRLYIWRSCKSESSTTFSFIAFQMLNLLGMAGSGYYVHRRHQWLQFQARQRIHQRVHGASSVLTM